jgi:hypothetical protein
LSRYTVSYKASDGEITEREISDALTTGLDEVMAYCHLRNDRRSFRLSRILRMVDSETDELIPNPWSEFEVGSCADGRDQLFSILAESLSAIRAVKFFILSTRGFAKLEAGKFLLFVRGLGDTSSYTDEELDVWLHAIWCGDVFKYKDGDCSEYQMLLGYVPPKLLPNCYSCALQIITGSGRRPVNPDLLARANKEFCYKS